MQKASAENFAEISAEISTSAGMAKFREFFYLDDDCRNLLHKYEEFMQKTIAESFAETYAEISISAEMARIR